MPMEKDSEGTTAMTHRGNESVINADIEESTMVLRGDT